MSAANKKSNIPYRNITKTNANLSAQVFKDICLTINISYDEYLTTFTNFEDFIDKKLLSNRNNIAHGKNVLLHFDDYNKINDTVVLILNKFKTDVINSAELKKYKV